MFLKRLTNCAQFNFMCVFFFPQIMDVNDNIPSVLFNIRTTISSNTKYFKVLLVIIALGLLIKDFSFDRLASCLLANRSTSAFMVNNETRTPNVL